jgi:hypothetical protein
LELRDAGFILTDELVLIDLWTKTSSPEAGIGEKPRESGREPFLLLPWGPSESFHQNQMKVVFTRPPSVHNIFPTILPHLSFCKMHFECTGQGNLTI